MKASALMAVLTLQAALAAAQNAAEPAMGSDPFGPFNPVIVLEPEPPQPPMPFRSHVGQPLANASLPDHVMAEQGKLTLFADFYHPEARGIPLYLINRTGRSINFDGQDGDVYIKLERQTPDGQWERAQAHQNSDCGNSYYRQLLLSGMHFKMLGYQPAQGEPARIRYVSYGSEACTSNTGEGLYTPVDVSAAQMDGIARRRSISAIHSQLTFGSKVKKADVESRVAILKMAEQLGECTASRTGATQWLKELEATPSPSAEERQAIPMVREVLQRNWGVRSGHNRLLRMCLDAVKARKNARPEFGSLKKHPEMAWEVIREIAGIEASHFSDLRDLPRTDNTLWKEAMMLAAAQVLKAPKSIAGPMTGLLGMGTMANDYLPDEILEPFVAGENHALSDVAIHALASRSRWERLVELGFKLNAERQLAVFLALVQGPYRDDGNATLYGVGGLRTLPDSGEQEESFWLHVVRQQPVKAACALSHFAESDFNPFSGTLFEPLKSCWRTEVENSERAGKDFELKGQEHEYRQALEFFVACRDEENHIPLLRSLLDHHGYIKQEGRIGDKPYSKQVFVLRRTAADELRKKREPVPADLVLEVSVTPTAKK